jgi:uncharacterized protein
VSDLVLRDVWQNRIVGAHACRLIEDTKELIALWFPAGAPQRLPAEQHGELLRIVLDEWTLVPGMWGRSGLMIARPGAAHSIWIWLDSPGWYVNLEEPMRRTSSGFDRLDQKLDIVVAPDGTYRWKDEDELEQAAAAGLLDAAEVRAEAQRVLEEWPFPTGWEDWRPDPAWPIPQLPDGWDRM